jgi:hypothetical protein
MVSEGGELFAERVEAGKRVYSFDVKKSIDGDMYLMITESLPSDTEHHRHHQIIVFQEHIKSFFEGLEKSINFMIPGSINKTYNVQKIREKYPQAYMKWTEELDLLLRNLYKQGKTINELAEAFQRKPSAIRARLLKLQLISDNFR